MECSCDCSCDVYDPPEFFKESTPIAKNEYRCCECGSKIQPGEQYENARGKWEGDWDTYKTCMPCVRIRTDFCPCGFMYGGLRETIWECLDFDYVTGESRYEDEDDE